MRCLGVFGAAPIAKGSSLMDLEVGVASEGNKLEPNGDDLATPLRFESGAVRLDKGLWSARPRSNSKAEAKRRECDERPDLGVAPTVRGPSTFGRENVNVVNLLRRRGRSTASAPLSSPMLWMSAPPMAS